MSRHLPRAKANVLNITAYRQLVCFFFPLFNFATRSMENSRLLHFYLLRASHAKNGHLCEYLHRYKFCSTVTGNFGGPFSALNLNVDSMFGNDSTATVQFNVFCRSCTGCEGKLFQDSNHGDFCLQHGKPRANTASWTSTERKKGERPDLLLVFFPEPKNEQMHILVLIHLCPS